MLRTLGGGCQVPVGGYATIEGDVIRLRGIVAAPDGSIVFRAEQFGEDAEAVGVELGEELLRDGAEKILAEVYSA